MTDHKSVPQTHTLPPTFRIPEWVLISRGPATFKISRRHRSLGERKMICSKVEGCCSWGVGSIRSHAHHVAPGCLSKQQAEPEEGFNAVMAAAFTQSSTPRARARWMLDKKHGQASASFEPASRRNQPGERASDNDTDNDNAGWTSGDRCADEPWTMPWRPR